MNRTSFFLPVRSAAVLALALAGAGAQAASLVAADAGAQQLGVSVGGDLIAVDLTLRTPGAVSFEVALDAADMGQWLRFNAVVSSTGMSLPVLQVALSGASFAWVGSVTPAFGTLASIDGHDTLQTLRFDPAEPFGVDLGAPFAQAGTQDWLFAPLGTQAGDRFTVTISAVPEPGGAVLALAGLGVVGWLVRRRG